MKRLSLSGALVLVAALILACGGGSAPAQPTAGPAPALRVATVNLLHGFFSETDAETLTERLGLVARALREQEVDIVGVQEASITSYGGDVAAELARMLNFEHVYQRSNPNLLSFTTEENEQLVRNIDFEEGVAVLSRFPISESESIDLPRVSDTENRIGLRATLATPWGPLDVYVTHLTNSGDATKNAAQAQALADWIASRPRELPAVLMGDFNAEEGSATIDLLTERFVDVFRAFDPGGPGHTCCQDAVTDAQPAEERKRIDYLFLVPAEAFAGQAAEARVFLDEPFELADGSALWASDHFGVVAALRLFP